MTKITQNTTPKTKTVSFLNRNIKISPRKLRLLANTIKKLTPATALTQLKFINSKSARLLLSSLQSLISDASHNHNLDPATFLFDKITVDDGPKFKRMDKSHSSRFSRGLIQKRHSRLYISLKGEAKNGSKS